MPKLSLVWFDFSKIWSHSVGQVSLEFTLWHKLASNSQSCHSLLSAGNVIMDYDWLPKHFCALF